MDCFFGCFGLNDCIRRKTHPFSRSFSWKKKELGVPRIRYASLWSYKEKGSSEKPDREIVQESLNEDDTVHHEPRQEAKFRKTHGATEDTHFEICRASDQRYLASDTYDKKINWDQQLGKSSHHPSSLPGTSTLPEEKSKSSRSEKFEEAKHHSGVDKGLDPAKLDVSPQTEYQVQVHGCESPYPTPLNLVPGMLTPGTIYPPKPQNCRIGAIRSQFVHAIPDQSQNTFKPEVVEEQVENSQNLKYALQNKEISGLLKPQKSKDEEGLPHSFHSPDMDRPITGIAAAYYDKNEHSRDSPTPWDGNGIPNTTTKYKEDQKVCWHATPFEVRLEKVLSDNNGSYPHRKLVDGKND